MKTRILTLFFTLSCLFHVSGQNNRIFWATDSDNLPQNSIKSIAPDRYGYIWLTTENGLVRYDGKNFEAFNNANTGIRNNRMVYITGNARMDSLYVSNDNEEDFLLIHQRNATRINPLKHADAITLLPGKESRFVSTGIPSMLFDVPKRPYKIPLSSGNYFLIDHGRIRFYHAKDQLQYHLDFEYETNSRFFTFADTLFYLKENGDYAIITNGKATWHPSDIKSKGENQLYWNIISGQVFYYAEKKLFQVRYKEGKLQKTLILDNEAFSITDISSFYFDHNAGILYLGSATKGLGTYTISPFTALTEKTRTEATGTEVYYAMNGHPGALITADGVKFTNGKFDRNLHFANSDKYAMVTDGNGDIWVKKGSVLSRYAKKNGYTKPRAWDFNKAINTIHLAPDGKIWFYVADKTTQTGSLYCFRPREKPVFEKFADAPCRINVMQQKDNHTLWIGSRTGVYKLDLDTKEMRRIPETENLRVRGLYLSGPDTAWAMTYEKGFILIRNNKKYTFPLDKNGYLLSAHCILEDQRGFFWISSNKGLFQVSKQALLNYAAKKSSQVYYHYYGKDSGFLSNEFNGGCQPCGEKSKDGIFYFPSMSGIVAFNPLKTNAVVPDHGIYIDKATLKNQKLSFKDTLKLERNYGRVTFYITSPYYGNQNNQNFEFRLDGQNTLDWVKVADDHTISFTNLYPGAYTMTVRKLSGFGSGFLYKKMIIQVHAPFWLTTRFLVFLLAALVLMILIIYHLRTNYIREKNILLEKKINAQTEDLKNTISTLRATREDLDRQVMNNAKLIRMITHDIKSPMRFMAMTSRHLYENFETAQKDQAEFRDNIKGIYSSAAQMLNFADDLLEYFKVNATPEAREMQSFDLREVIENKIMLFESIADSQQVNLLNNVPPNTGLWKSKPLISIIIHNLLDNAIKYTYKGTIIFSFERHATECRLRIRDTGKGMDKDVLAYYQEITREFDPRQVKSNKHMGLYIVMELLLILGGRMTIESKKNQGTIVTLTFITAAV